MNDSRFDELTQKYLLDTLTDSEAEELAALLAPDESVAERLVGEGFLSYDDLSVIEPEDLMEMGELSAEAVDAIVTEAERRATLAEEAAADERRKQRELERIAQATADADAAEAAMATAAGQSLATGEMEQSADGSAMQEQEQQAVGQIPETDGVGGEDAQASVPPSAGS